MAYHLGVVGCSPEMVVLSKIGGPALTVPIIGDVVVTILEEPSAAIADKVVSNAPVLVGKKDSSICE